jgi:hypothetical protein
VLSLFWFSSIPSLVIPRQMVGQYLSIMLQPLSSTSFLIHNSLSYHSALFVYCCLLLLPMARTTASNGKPQSRQSVFQPRFEQSAEHKSSRANLLGDCICIVWATNMVQQTTKIKNTLLLCPALKNFYFLNIFKIESNHPVLIKGTESGCGVGKQEWYPLPVTYSYPTQVVIHDHVD